VLAHRIEIIKQTSQKLFDIDVDHGIIQAGFPTDPSEPVQVASIQTLWTRAIRLKKIELPTADLVVVDECHHAPAETYRKIIDAYPDAGVLGLTATPCRGDGRGLGNLFDAIIECPQVPELIEQQFLVPTIVYAPVDPDLSDVQTEKGDYVARQLEDVMDRDDLVGDIISHSFKYAERRRTVCFATGVAHSLHIAAEFNRAGVSAEHIDAVTPRDERDAILRRLAAGDLDVVTNAMVLTEGWDQPAVSCCILARPTKRMGLYRQMVGRVIRPAPDKPNAIVLDHSGATYRHGFVEDLVMWTLATDRRATAPAHTRERSRTIDGYTSRLIDCSQCGALRVAGNPCAHCGFMPQRPPEAVIFRDGDLSLVDRNSRTAFDPTDPVEQNCWHRMLTFIAADRGYKPGWIAHKYKEKFGGWPAERNVMPLRPAPEIVSWVRSRQIAYAKSLGRRA
jgi:DNA repair protein RadD